MQAPTFVLRMLLRQSLTSSNITAMVHVNDVGLLEQPLFGVFVI